MIKTQIFFIEAAFPNNALSSEASHSSKIMPLFSGDNAKILAVCCFKSKISFNNVFTLDHMKSFLESNSVYELMNTKSVIFDRFKKGSYS